MTNRIALLLILILWSPWSTALAAISYVGGQTGSFVGNAVSTDITFALTGGLAGTPAIGDLVITTYCVSTVGDAAFTIGAPDNTPYTEFGTEGWANDLFDTNRRTAYRVMPNPTETVVRLGQTFGTSNAGSYAIHVFRGVHATPLEQAVVQANNLNTSLPNPTAITPTTTGTYIYVAGCGALATTRQGVYTSGDLTAFLSSAQDDTNASEIGAGYLAWTSGAFDAGIFGGGGTDNADHSNSWIVVPLAPEADPSGATRSNRGALFMLLRR